MAFTISGVAGNGGCYPCTELSSIRMPFPENDGLLDARHAGKNLHAALGIYLAEPAEAPLALRYLPDFTPTLARDAATRNWSPPSGERHEDLIPPLKQVPSQLPALANNARESLSCWCPCLAETPLPPGPAPRARIARARTSLNFSPCQAPSP